MRAARVKNERREMSALVKTKILFSIIRMGMRRNILLLTVSLLLLLTACSQNETTNQSAHTSVNQSSSDTTSSTSGKMPPADVVRAEASNVEVKAGGAADASVKLTIANGYHINANPASASYLIATELTAEPSEGITPNKPVYPASTKRKFAFAPDPLDVYEGEATIKLPLNAAGNAKKGAHTLKGKLRIQACDEQSCFQPKNIELSIPVTVQ
jgi:hypothetical protein